MSSFIAQYPGTCCQCGERIVPGQACRYWGDEDQEVGHDVCPETLDEGTLSRNERHCACGLIHAGECP